MNASESSGDRGPVVRRAMPAFLGCFADGCQWAVLGIAKSRRVLFSLYVWFMTLCALYTVDVTYLIAQLVRVRLHS